FNGDGKPDVAVNTGRGVSILRGTGLASAPLAAGQAITLSNAGCLLAADLNGDHIPDLLVPQPSAVDAYLNNGDGTFSLKSSTPGSTGTGHTTVADFDRDGKLDFATTGNSLALGNGDGTFQTPVPLVANPPLDGFNDIGAGDLNNDGWPDLVLTSGAEFEAAIYGSCPKSVIGVEGLSIQGVPVRGVLRSTLMRHPSGAWLGGRRRCQTCRHWA